jgi:hypothetical protein
MKKPLEICILFFALFSYSCEKIPFEDEVVDMLTINGETHSFINNEGKPYYDNFLTSLNDRHIYRLKMCKNVEYRISATQPSTNVNQIILTLVNKGNDTLATSNNDLIRKSIIVIIPPETTDYYLIVNLEKWSNYSLGYRLNFEELFEHSISFSDFNWTYDGTWQINNSNEAVMENYNSNILRHLKLNCSELTNPDLSFVIKSNSTVNPNIGVAIGASTGLTQIGENAYELPSIGYALLTYNYENRVYNFLTLNYSYISCQVNILPNVLNYSIGIKIDLKYDSTEKSYRAYINNDFCCFMQGPVPLNDLYILVEDNGEGATVIKDLTITNGPI